jgi:enterochelin esterase-like enzyme
VRTLVLLVPFILIAQAPPRLVSPEVSPKREVTFRFRAPNAKEVLLSREGATRVPMTRDDSGVWSLTVGPLDPDFYGYSFVADGVSYIDPVNGLMKPNILSPQSMVLVPGQTPLIWEPRNVPRGVVHRHFYKSQVIGDHRDFYVYLPPNYDGKTKLPVLYLLHGFSDDAGGWTSVGQAHVIFDNLLAEGKIDPMIVVMTLGYGAPEILRASTNPRPPDIQRRNREGYRDALFQEVIPAVEKTYKVDTRREKRAIAGLSMGGGQTLFIGLNHLDRFAYIGAFSSGINGDNPAQLWPTLDAAANAKLRKFWIGCGKDDFLIEPNRKLHAWLNEKGVKHDWAETEGAHNWLVWRRYLAQFAPLLWK